MKLYSNVIFLYFCDFMAVICLGITLIMHIVNKNYSFLDIGSCAFEIVLILWLAYAYRHKQKDIVKGLVIVVLSIYFIYYLACLDFIRLSETSWIYDYGFAIVLMVVNAFVFILHMIINVTNEPSEKLVKINNLFIFLLSLMMFFIIVYILFANVEEYKSWILPTIGIIFIYNTIICVEGRIEYHRELRSKNLEK